MYSQAGTLDGKINTDIIIRDADGAHIPNDARNADWQTYQAWVAAGNKPTPYVAPPPPSPSLTFLQFMALFTAAEQATIVNSADTQTKLFLLMATGAGTIGLADPQVIGGVSYLATIGLIAQARVAQVLAGKPPT